MRRHAMELKSNSVRKTLDAVPTNLKRTGVGATIEIVGYAGDHPTIEGHPLNDEKELLQAVSYLHARLRREAASAASA
jgi:hypothetical protein